MSSTEQGMVSTSPCAVRSRAGRSSSTKSAMQRMPASAGRSGVSSVSLSPGPSQPRTGSRVKAPMVSTASRIIARWSATLCVGTCTTPWPMNSHSASRAAPATRGHAVRTEALTLSVGRMPSRSNSAMKRQNPTRMPSSCQARLGTSGGSAAPVGGESGWRGIGFSISQCSTVATGRRAMAAPPGSAMRGRSTLATWASRSPGRMACARSPPRVRRHRGADAPRRRR